MSTIIGDLTQLKIINDSSLTFVKQPNYLKIFYDHGAVFWFNPPENIISSTEQILRNWNSIIVTMKCVSVDEINSNLSHVESAKNEDYSYYIVEGIISIDSDIRKHIFFRENLVFDIVDNTNLVITEKNTSMVQFFVPNADKIDLLTFVDGAPRVAYFHAVTLITDPNRLKIFGKVKPIITHFTIGCTIIDKNEAEDSEEFCLFSCADYGSMGCEAYELHTSCGKTYTDEPASVISKNLYCPNCGKKLKRK